LLLYSYQLITAVLIVALPLLQALINQRSVIANLTAQGQLLFVQCLQPVETTALM